MEFGTSIIIRHLWLFILVIGLISSVGLHTYLLKVDDRLIQEEVIHRGTVTLNAIRAILQQHLDATVAFSALLQGSMTVHQDFTDEEKAEAMEYARIISMVHPTELVAMHMVVGSDDNAVSLSHQNKVSQAAYPPLQQDENIKELALGTPRIWFLQNAQGEWLMRAAYHVIINNIPAYTASDWSFAGMINIAASDTNSGLVYQVNLEKDGKVVPIYGHGQANEAANSSINQWNGSFELAGIRLSMYATATDRLRRQISPAKSYSALILGAALSMLLALIFYYKSRYSIKLREEVEERTSKMNRDRVTLRSREHELASLIDNAGNAILVTDKHAKIYRANPASTQMFGYAPDEWGSITISDLVVDESVFPREQFAEGKIRDDIERLLGKPQEVQCKRKDGSVFPCDYTLSAFDSGDSHSFSIIVHDTSERKEAEKELKQLSYFDVLTGLANRRLFNDRLEQAIAIGHRQNCSIALMFIDLDKFKKINDLFGHTTGDLALKEAAQRMANSIRESDTAARLGGDEFALILHKLEAPDCMRVAQKIIEKFKQPVSIGKQEFVMGASIGIAMYPQDGASPEELIKRADSAMYKGKINNLDFNFFTEEVEIEMLRRLRLEQDLKLALLNQCGKLILYYQTQHQMNGSICGVEALIRWQHPEFGMLPPDEFISIAEETGQIQAITIWVLNEACKQALIWDEEGIRPERIAINVSAVELVNRSMSKEIITAIQRTGANPAWFEIEITEGAAMSDPRIAILIMEELVSSGISISIDDFGTGYSSLTYIKRFPASMIKIDRSFIGDLPMDLEDSAIVRSTISMIKSLGKCTLAEGVETLDQADFLLSEGCDFMQGYHFSRPMSAADETLFLKKCG